jgi:hypothetical protein
MKMENENELEARDFPVRVKIQQSAKGFSYWEVTIRSDDIDGAKVLLNQAVEMAKAKCEDLNKMIEA